MAGAMPYCPTHTNVFVPPGGRCPYCQNLPMGAILPQEIIRHHIFPQLPQGSRRFAATAVMLENLGTLDAATLLDAEVQQRLANHLDTLWVMGGRLQPLVPAITSLNTLCELLTKEITYYKLFFPSNYPASAGPMCRLTNWDFGAKNLFNFSPCLKTVKTCLAAFPRAQGMYLKFVGEICVLVPDGSRSQVLTQALGKATCVAEICGCYTVLNRLVESFRPGALTKGGLDTFIQEFMNVWGRVKTLRRLLGL
jgi:hypothetical protein